MQGYTSTGHQVTVTSKQSTVILMSVGPQVRSAFK